MKLTSQFPTTTPNLLSKRVMKGKWYEVANSFRSFSSVLAVTKYGEEKNDLEEEINLFNLNLDIGNRGDHGLTDFKIFEKRI